MSAGVTSWSQQYRGRRAIASRFGDVFCLPLARRASDLLMKTARNGDRVLEVGAGDRRKREQLSRRFPDLTYQSLDIDQHGDHDYHDWSEVNVQFDLIFAFEVVEHIPLNDLTGWLRHVSGHLHPGGRVLLSTPNIYYPPDFLRDVTHCTPLCFDELASLVESTGLKVHQVFRIYNDPVHRILLRRYLFGWMFRMLGIDFARQIVLIAENED